MISWFDNKMPELTFFRVETESGGRHLVCSRESSLGLLAIRHFFKDTNYIKPLDLNQEGWDKEYAFNTFMKRGVYFADVRKHYNARDKSLVEMYEDYLIAKIAGVKQ